MSAKPNIALIIFNIVFLPFIIAQLILIYFFGSRYNIQGMEFLDVMFHASNPYFNQEVGATIDVLHEDVRATIKRETKLFEEPITLPKKLSIKEQLTKEIIIKQPKKVTMKEPEPDEISIESEKSDVELNDETIDDNSEENSETETDSETERILDTYTDESHQSTEEESILKNRMNKKTNFDLDVHIDQLFDDLENSVTTMTQTEQAQNKYTQNEYSSSQID